MDPRLENEFKQSFEELLFCAKQLNKKLKVIDNKIVQLGGQSVYKNDK